MESGGNEVPAGYIFKKVKWRGSWSIKAPGYWGGFTSFWLKRRSVFFIFQLPVFLKTPQWGVYTKECFLPEVIDGWSFVGGGEVPSAAKAL
jgi:hypothetical protein